MSQDPRSQPAAPPVSPVVTPLGDRVRNPYGIEVPRARPSGAVERWIDVWAWIIAFALLLAAPCVPEPSTGGSARADPRQRVSAPRADAPRRP